MKIVLHTNWAWREEFTYDVDALPDDWNDMDIQAKAEFLDRHEMVHDGIHRWPLAMLEIVDVTIDGITTEEPQDESNVN